MMRQSSTSATKNAMAPVGENFSDGLGDCMLIG